LQPLNIEMWSQIRLMLNSDSGEEKYLDIVFEVRTLFSAHSIF